MFEIGVSYEFDMEESDGGRARFVGTVERYEHPLLKLANTDLITVEIMRFSRADEAADTVEPRVGSTVAIDGSVGQIINVASRAFVSARKLKSKE